MHEYTELKTYRYERKFVASRFSRLAAEAVVKQNSAFFYTYFSTATSEQHLFRYSGIGLLFR